MKSILLKVPELIPKELDQIQEKEGLNSRTSTIVFLIKYYFLTKQNSLGQSVKLLENLLEKIEVSKLPSLKEQLKDI